MKTSRMKLFFIAMTAALLGAVGTANAADNIAYCVTPQMAKEVGDMNMPLNGLNVVWTSYVLAGTCGWDTVTTEQVRFVKSGQPGQYIHKRPLRMLDGDSAEGVIQARFRVVLPGEAI